MKSLTFITIALLSLLRVVPAAGQQVSFSAPWTSTYRVDPDHPHHFINDEGHHLFLLNKTAWAFFGSKDPRGVLQRARDQGITVLRVALEGTPYLEQLGIDLWPWGGTRLNPEFETMNQEYWKRVEERVRLAGEMGIGLDVVLYFTLHPDSAAFARQTPYLEQALRVLGRYANVFTWEIANEYTRNESFQDAVGEYLARNDPRKRPVISSDGTTDDAVWPDKRWMSMALVHTCTGSTPAYDLRDWYQRVAWNVRAHGKPAFNNESGREIRHKNDDPVHRRKQGWIWNTSGAYWTWHSWEGCEGIDDANYRGPGQEFLRPMSEFFQGIPFWELDPNHTALMVQDSGLVQSTLASSDRNLVVSYLCTRRSGDSVTGSQARFRLPDGTYRVRFLNPADLSAVGELRIRAAGLGRPAVIELPAFTDDLLIMIDRERSDARTRIKDTG